MHLGHPRRFLESRFGTDADRGGPSGAIGKNRHPSEDTVARKKSAFQIEIRGRDADGPPSLVTLDDPSVEDVRSAEQARCILDSSELQQLPNRRTPRRHHLTVLERNRELLLHPHLEASDPAELLKRLDGSLAAAAESKIRPLDHPIGRGPQGCVEMIQKGVRIKRQQPPVRLEHQNLIRPCPPEKASTALQRHQRRICRLPKHHRW